MSIVTKTGDKGETGLFSSDKTKKIRISKSSTRIETIGSIDEANTFLGLASSFVKNKKLKIKITEVQKHLFEVGAILAGATVPFDKTLPEKMEKEIDEMDKELPKLTNFILPGGGKAGSLLFMARTFVRRAERRLVSLSKKEKINPEILVYINRLSDYVYTLARYSNFKEGIKEEIWKTSK
jgi:cob(I)alamin adenosyltransferase